MKILHASLLYTCINYSIVFIPCVKTCLSLFSLSLSFLFHAKIRPLQYRHPHVAPIIRWKLSYLSPLLYETRSNSQRTRLVLEYRGISIFPKTRKFFRFYYYLSIPPRGFLPHRFFFYIVLRILCNFFYLKRVKLIYFNRE